MRTVILGKIIEELYSVDSKLKEIEDENGEIKDVFTGIPVITKKEKIVDWREICSFDGEPRYNKKDSLFSWLSHNEFNISENETVRAECETFRADLNEIHVKTSKVLEIFDYNKYESESEHINLIYRFNEQMILSNEKLKAYCDLHKMSYTDTDCIELFKLVYPNEKYEVVDGTMRVESTSNSTIISLLNNTPLHCSSSNSSIVGRLE